MSRRVGLRGNPLWTTAPSALLHTPGLWTAVAAGTLLLAVAATFAPAFLSATERELLTREIDNASVTRFGAGISFQISSLPLDRAVRGRPLHVEQRRVFSRRVSEDPRLGSVVEGILSPEIEAAAQNGSRSRTAKLMFRTDGARHVRILEGEAEGVLIPELLARGLRAGPGASIDVRYQGGPPVRMTVGGVYETLYTTPRTGFWRSWSEEIWPCIGCDPPPQPILVDRPQLLGAMSTLGVESAVFAWDAPLRVGGLTAPDAEGVARTFSAFLAEATGVPGAPSEGAEILLCCGFRFEPFRTRTSLTSAMPAVLTIVDRRMIALEGPVRVLRLAGVLVAVVTVAAAGAFATAARRREYTLLYATGLRTSSVALKGFLESVAPAAVGAAAGLGLSLLLVAWLAPEGPMSGPALRSTIGWAAIVWAAAASLVGAVTAALFRRHAEVAHRTGMGLPFDVALILVGVYLLDRITGTGALVVDPETGIETPSLALLALPVAGLAGIGGLAARAFHVGLSRARERLRMRSEALYLAVHRLAGARRLALLLVATGAASIGLLLHALTVARSLDATVHAKSRVFVGSEVAAQIDPEFVPSREYGLPHTVVTRWRSGGRFASTGRQFDVLAVDPDTVPGAAFWDDSFASVALEELMARLEAPGDGALPVIVAGHRDDLPERTTLILGRTEVSVRIVATARAFPGMSSGDPLVVVGEEALRGGGPSGPLVGGRATGAVWVRASPRAAARRLIAAGIHPDDILTARRVEDLPSIEAAVGTFAILAGLGLVSGLLVLVVLIMYVQARQRAQVVSYALARRMGLRRGENVLALGLEVGTMLLTSFLVGAVVGVGISFFVVPQIDPLPAIATDPLMRSPVTASILTLTALAACTAIASWLAERAARRTNVAEVMRVAE
ncbi:MAG TPA: FtsX-like permease family protein [Actinomycetota bacterium]